MRFVWTDEGDDPTWETGDRHGVDGYFAPLFDPLTPTVLDEAGRRGHVQGGYIGHKWLPDLGPDALAQRVSKAYDGLGGKQRQLRIMFNLEQHDPEFVAATLEAWRDLKPYVPTSWSPEGMQGGWMSPEFVQRVLTCRVRVVPQAYGGSSRPLQRRESDVVKADVVRRGFPENVVSCFYDAATLEPATLWDGYAYTMGHLS